MSSSTAVTKKYLKSVVIETKKKMIETAEKYGLSSDKIPDRNWSKLELVMNATTLDEAALLSTKACDSLFFTVLSMWGRKEISGPVTHRSLEKKAKQAEGLATMLEQKGQPEAAEKQREKASNFYKEAEALRGPV